MDAFWKDEITRYPCEDFIDIICSNCKNSRFIEMNKKCILLTVLGAGVR